MTRKVWTHPASNAAVLNIPLAGDHELRANGFQEAELEAPERLYAVIRNPLERFQEFHRTYWIENPVSELPQFLRSVGFQRDWPISMVAGHAAALAAANVECPGLIPLGPYSPQMQFYGDPRPALLVYDYLEFEVQKISPELKGFRATPKRFKMAPAAIVGGLKSRIESAYAADLAIYSAAKASLDGDIERLRGALRA